MFIRFGPDREDGGDVVLRMHAGQLVHRCKRRLVAHQLGEFARIQRLQHGSQPVRAFRMVRARVMVQAGAVGEQQHAHAGGSSRLRMTKR